MKSSRAYTMSARARAVAATRTAILDALVDLSRHRLLTEIALTDVATAAGVSVQTVLRQFGSRADLFEAAIAHGRTSIAAERDAPVGDVHEAVRVIVEHYELRGASVVMLLAQERSEPLIERVTTTGREMHRAWVAEVFAPFLTDVEGAHEEAVDLLVVACDVYTWKLLRLDRSLSRAATQERMERLVRAVLADLGQPLEEREIDA